MTDSGTPDVDYGPVWVTPLRMHDVQFERANRLEAQLAECHRIIGAVESLVKDSNGSWLWPSAFDGLAGEIQNVIAGEC